MRENDSAAEKRIVSQLEFGSKTAKRVGWEQFEFTIAGPHQVEVTNASYGFEKDDHSYIVGIEKAGGLPHPAECSCPADVHREPDCKHKVALVTIGSLTVLNAAVNFDKPARPLSKQTSEELNSAEVLQTDGGVATTSGKSETCPNDNSNCRGPKAEKLPCFDCYRMGEG